MISTKIMKYVFCLLQESSTKTTLILRQRQPQRQQETTIKNDNSRNDFNSRLNLKFESDPIIIRYNWRCVRFIRMSSKKKLKNGVKRCFVFWQLTKELKLIKIQMGATLKWFFKWLLFWEMWNFFVWLSGVTIKKQIARMHSI